VALLDGDVTMASFDEAHLHNKVLLDLVATIQVHRDAALSARYPRGIPNRLTITLADGRQLVKEVEFPCGHAGNPMTDGEVEQKFRSLVAPRYGPERVDAMLAGLWEMDQMGHAASLPQLFELVSK
jgi:2-methylcitrate dehydratase